MSNCKGSLPSRDDLALQIDREDYGTFPVSVLTLGAAGWRIVDRAHSAAPSSLVDAMASRSIPEAPLTGYGDHEGVFSNQEDHMQKESLTALVRHHLAPR
jgi:hypothetical protein